MSPKLIRKLFLGNKMSLDFHSAKLIGNFLFFRAKKKKSLDFRSPKLIRKLFLQHIARILRQNI